MSLKETLSLLEETIAESNLVPEDVDPRVRAGVEAKVRNAKEAIGGLKTTYRNEVRSAILTIEVGGETAEMFAEIAKAKLKVLSYNFTGLIDKLYDAVRARGGQVEFGTHEAQLLLSEVLALKGSLDIQTLPPLLTNEAKPTAFGRPTHDAIEYLIESSYGTSLYETYTLRQLQDDALKSRFAGQVLPVVLYNYKVTPTSGELLPIPRFRVDAGAKPTLNSVKAALLKVKKDLTGKPAEEIEELENQDNLETN